MGGRDRQQCRCHRRHYGITPPGLPPGYRPERCAPRPATAPRARRSAHAYFYPWENRASSMQTHSPCHKQLHEKLINQCVGLQMRLGELDLPVRALFRQSQDRRNCLLGQSSLGGLWEQGPRVGIQQPPAHPSIPILVPLPAPPQLFCPHPPATATPASLSSSPCNPTPASHPAPSCHCHGLAPWEPPSAQPLP